MITLNAAQRLKAAKIKPGSIADDLVKLMEADGYKILGQGTRAFAFSKGNQVVKAVSEVNGLPTLKYAEWVKRNHSKHYPVFHKVEKFELRGNEWVKFYMDKYKPLDKDTQNKIATWWDEYGQYQEPAKEDTLVNAMLHVAKAGRALGYDIDYVQKGNKVANLMANGDNIVIVDPWVD